jgi:hypothetical protein
MFAPAPRACACRRRMVSLRCAGSAGTLSGALRALIRRPVRARELAGASDLTCLNPSRDRSETSPRKPQPAGNPALDGLQSRPNFANFPPGGGGRLPNFGPRAGSKPRGGPLWASCPEVGRSSAPTSLPTSAARRRQQIPPDRPPTTTAPCAPRQPTAGGLADHDRRATSRTTVNAAHGNPAKPTSTGAPANWLGCRSSRARSCPPGTSDPDLVRSHPTHAAKSADRHTNDRDSHRAIGPDAIHKSSAAGEPRGYPAPRKRPWRSGRG